MTTRKAPATTPGKLLQQARRAQTRLWDVARKLEDALGLDTIDTTRDLRDFTLANLKELFSADSEDVANPEDLLDDQDDDMGDAGSDHDGDIGALRVAGIHSTQVYTDTAEQIASLSHPYSDQAGNGFCFVCGLTEDHPESHHNGRAPRSLAGTDNMDVTFDNVTITVRARDPHQAYERLCAALSATASVDGASRPDAGETFLMGYQTDTFRMNTETTDHDTSELFPGAGMEIEPHAKVLHGLCPTCHHYGDDCTGKESAR